MPAHRLMVVFVSVGSICGGLLCWPASAQSPAPPAVAAPPQQMPVYGVPATYPSTYPSTSVPAYPFTSIPAATDPVLAPYDGVLPGITAPAPNNAGAGPDPLIASRPLDLNARAYDTNAYVERSLVSDECWGWQVLPAGLMFKSYLAGGREPRIASQWVHERNHGWLWDVTLGGRAGLLRYGTYNDLWPQGWQLDVEGAAFPRLDLEQGRDLIDSDYRFGIPLTTRQGPWEAKLGYYHLSSHIGDEYLLKHPGFQRINSVRDSVVLAAAVYFGPDMRLYSEADWAFYVDGDTKPWAFQFGVDVSPADPTGIGGAPFFAINAHLREENDFGGNMTVQTGWQWRGRTGHLLRLGMQYFNGMSDQYQFYNIFEEQIGMGLWYDY